MVLQDYANKAYEDKCPVVKKISEAREAEARQRQEARAEAA